MNDVAMPLVLDLSGLVRGVQVVWLRLFAGGDGRGQNDKRTLSDNFAYRKQGTKNTINIDIFMFGLTTLIESII